MLDLRMDHFEPLSLRRKMFDQQGSCIEGDRLVYLKETFDEHEAVRS
jgi:hypothetical protein